MTEQTVALVNFGQRLEFYGPFRLEPSRKKPGKIAVLMPLSLVPDVTTKDGLTTIKVAAPHDAA